MCFGTRHTYMLKKYGILEIRGECVIEKRTRSSQGEVSLYSVLHSTMHFNSGRARTSYSISFFPVHRTMKLHSMLSS